MASRGDKTIRLMVKIFPLLLRVVRALLRDTFSVRILRNLGSRKQERWANLRLIQRGYNGTLPAWTDAFNPGDYASLCQIGFAFVSVVGSQC